MASFLHTRRVACHLLCLSFISYVGCELILIKGGEVVNYDTRKHADVLINGTLIQEVAPAISAPQGSTVIDATGKLVMPGGIDPHTHLAMPFMGTTSVDDFFSGHKAALAGGTTMHIDFVLPVEGDIEAGLRVWREKASIAAMDYGFHVGVTTWNDKVASDMAAAVAAGVNSFKFFMAYKGALMVSDMELLAGFQRCKELQALAMVHAENGDAVAAGQDFVFEQLGITGPEGHALSRPSLLEGEATGRAIRLARFVDTPLYVVHVMSRDALDEVAKARQAGQRVIGEPVASGLALDESMLWHPDFQTAAQYVMSPPIRGVEDQGALREALAGGVLQVVATDHAVFNSTQKARGSGDFRKIPNGVNGLEERLHIVWQTMRHGMNEPSVEPIREAPIEVNSGLLAAEDFVRVTSTAAAQTFNIFPRKGYVAPGSDADVIVFDPLATHTISAATHHSNMDTNVYEGWQVRGKVLTTISLGRLVWHEGRLNVEPGSGRFVATPPGGRLFESGQADAIKPRWLADLENRAMMQQRSDAASDRNARCGVDAKGWLW